MGQTIQVEVETLGDIAVFSTDRSLTGQDGAGFESAEAAAAGSDFPARLAQRLFATDPDIDHVYVASNQVVVRRRTEWASSAAAAATVISELFRHYPDE